MNPSNLKLCSELIDQSYVTLASNALNTRENMLKQLLSQRCLPAQGWDQLTIRYILDLLALMDTNNFPNKVGVGERESRIYSDMVSLRHYSMGHGIGRSGDIAAVQPKAAGSSLILKLTKHLVRDAIKLSGYQNATGMALTLCLLTLKSLKPDAFYVLWPRIDQKTCLKCIFTANLVPIVIENIQQGDCITTNMEMMNKLIESLGIENILCILTTTSCFAPRVPDKIEEVAILAKKFNLFHLINNAYGIQCTKIANMLNQGNSHGSIDLVVQSTDKNFMVPVGGSIVFSYKKEMLAKVSELYPGRGSAAPILDLFITLLEMGKEGYLQLLKDRKSNTLYFKEKLQVFALKHEERLLDTPDNSISLGLTLSKWKQQFLQNYEQQLESNEVTKLGSVLYCKQVMGSRILTDRKAKSQCGIEFKNYGSHIDEYTHMPYMTVACAIGMTKFEIDQFMKRLEESWL